MVGTVSGPARISGSGFSRFSGLCAYAKFPRISRAQETHGAGSIARTCQKPVLVTDHLKTWFSELQPSKQHHRLTDRLELGTLKYFTLYGKTYDLQRAVDNFAYFFGDPDNLVFMVSE